MKRLGVGLLSGLTFLACGSAFDASSAPTADQACTDMARTRCERLQACSATDMQLRYADEGSCEALEKANCMAFQSAPGNGSTPTHVEACSKAIPAWACADFLNLHSIPTACQQQTGTGASGSACAFPGQCQTGFCAVPPTSSCGLCADPPALGASCAALTSCGLGVICTSDTQTCAIWGSTGAPCGKGAPCGAGLSCVGADATIGTQGNCQPAGEMVGTVCDATQALAPACDRNSGLVCNSKTKLCATIALAAAGAPCGSVGSLGTPCANGALCVGASGAAPGACVAAAADGAACDTVSGPPCLQLSRCIVPSGGGTAGTCQPGDASSCQ